MIKQATVPDSVPEVAKSAPETGQTVPVQDQLIDVRELCRLTSLAKSTVYDLLSAESTPFATYYFGKCVRFRLSEVWQWIEASKGKRKLKRRRPKVQNTS